MVQFVEMFNYFIFIFFTFASCVVGDEDFCVTYDFEDDLDKEFCSNICEGSWVLKKYSDIGFDTPNEQSTAFIAPSQEMSCTSSFIFTMHKGGIIELSVYYSLVSETDLLQVLVYQKQPNGPDRIVGMKIIHDNSNQGWNSLRIKLTGSDSYSGYFTIFGRASSDSYIMVDSFKYESPTLVSEQFLCTVYESGSDTDESPIIEEESTDDDSDLELSSTTEINSSTQQEETTTSINTTEDSSTTEQVSTIEESMTTTEQFEENSTTQESSTTDLASITSDTTTESPDSQYCVTHNFEEDYDLFGGTGICRRLNMDPFTRRLYSAFGLDSPQSLSTFYIAPTHRMSCIASSPFTMHENGVLQVNAYLQTLSLTDQISVAVYKKVSPTVDQIVGSLTTNPRLDYGWNLFNITLSGDAIYEGYVAFMGKVAIRSVALIDSFRYIPPSARPDESSCNIYEETPALTTTTETGIDPSTTQQPETEENGCVVYHFGQDFNTLFKADGVCRFSRNWELRNYSTLKVESPSVESVSCIVPSSGTSSCTSSFVFPMSATGVVEVRLYMEPMVLSDQVEVIVYQINEDGSSLVVGRASTGRQYGWTTILIELAGNGDFNGQITIMGRTSIRSFFLVDHFRYIPPTLDEQQCPVYSENN